MSEWGSWGGGQLGLLRVQFEPLGINFQLLGVNFGKWEWIFGIWEFNFDVWGVFCVKFRQLRFSFEPLRVMFCSGSRVWASGSIFRYLWVDFRRVGVYFGFLRSSLSVWESSLSLLEFI